VCSLRNEEARDWYPDAAKTETGKVIDLAKKIWNRTRRPDVPGFSFDRPLVLIQSDDWGRVGVRDKEGFEQLRADGVQLGQHPYDFYTLETAEDLDALQKVLAQHRDSTGRTACVLMNFVTANLNFPKMAENDFGQIELLPLSRDCLVSGSVPDFLKRIERGFATASSIRRFMA
jgi:hypothetical protein